mmetsp:Transcript_27537/g.41668  ORF Transcript_27537/g.41668 Transcript_27537/m.41668 type:complete len:277 (-) Transcript_27537:97-927(-)|eukprot:CAMPEP_0178906494 /NCGR_PEP_ID=MMETSP0786-20121207/6860_1 /TAXON_ID=186022 /ORGANISM="Thalassionema frauenfeldii, Strain CCMP 1798" /LENGTH=276 /DNA_ID=CAMNT_0020578215 /DNA_START=103 /DNA_END=933 /DNA_ORIENTATION=-
MTTLVHDEKNVDSSDENSSSSSSDDYSSLTSRDSNSASSSLPNCDEYSIKVKAWVERVPIGLGLCPWAIKHQKRLKYITCDAGEDVTTIIRAEGELLIQPWNSTLVVCPHVLEWNKDFGVFDKFVKDLGKETGISAKVTLVSFHPEFLRWRSLPEDLTVGNVVLSHRGFSGFQKSLEMFSATILETSNAMFGRRKIKVRFHNDQKEQYVPTDWLNVVGPPLPDNLMHQAPYPTIHLIRNGDLGTMCVRDVSRVKRKNARRMMKVTYEVSSGTENVV